MLFSNPRATFQPYPAELQHILNVAAGQAAHQRLSTWSHIAPQPTPAWNMPGLAAQLGVGSITIKDESKRSPLSSFKALGAPNALVLLVQRRWPDKNWTAADLFAGKHAASMQDLVVISATDGNHGRALAAAAQSLGLRCVIVLHAEVLAEREAAIAAYGADIVRVQGDYDDSVREAARLAQANGWQVVSDTTYPGYQDVPRDVMQGYAVIVDELLQGTSANEPCPWTHVFLQGGVGAYPAAIVADLWERYGENRPRFVIVEPEQADCLIQSAMHGQPTPSTGNNNSVMAGLACGEVSPLAWRFMQPAADFFATVPDAQAEQAMRTLAQGSHGDAPIVAGESGVAGLAALQVLVQNPAWRDQAGLDAQAKILLINTEGATAPGVYASIVGKTGEEVLAAQQAWHDAVRG